MNGDEAPILFGPFSRIQAEVKYYYDKRQSFNLIFVVEIMVLLVVFVGFYCTYKHNFCNRSGGVSDSDTDAVGRARRWKHRDKQDEKDKKTGECDKPATPTTSFRSRIHSTDSLASRFVGLKPITITRL